MEVPEVLWAEPPRLGIERVNPEGVSGDQDHPLIPSRQAQGQLGGGDPAAKDGDAGLP
jgi:hypothetical protein